ncbi:MAG: hypothetical protein AAFW89_05560 [Bacteroidota bacterium]
MKHPSNYHSLLLLLLLILVPVGLAAQTKEKSSEEKKARKVQQSVEKQIRRYQERDVKSKSTSQASNLSLQNFIRGGLQTGNLIQVPYITNVNISAGYWGSFVNPSRITWPKGSGVEYGHTMSFIVAGEVNTDLGTQQVIISESYNRSGGDQTNTHKYQFTPVPGYYNMFGNQESPNRLNDNANDRQRLQDAGFYFVGGLNEDANGNGELDPGEDLNNNGELDTQLENRAEYTSQSNLPETWPEFWPPQSYVGDDRQPGDNRPGVRAGRWNGAFGAFVRGDQESYYKADDRDNDEFPYFPFINPETGQPDTRPWTEGGRRGMGLEVTARQYQWASILAEDIFVTTFDVENISRKDIPRAIIAMLVDYDIGGATADNNALFDTQDDITYQWHTRNLVRNGFRVGYGGVGFLESPGIANDGIDNDADGLTDEARDDGIDNDGDWAPWTDVNNNGRYDNEDLNNNFILDAGEDLDGDGSLTIEPINDDVGSDGIGPENENYPGPDPDGTEANGRPDPGESNFEFTDNDEIDQIGLTNMVIRTPSDFDRDLDDDELFWADYIQPVPENQFIIPTETDDIIYTYSSGFVTIPIGTAQRFSIAFFCGNDFDDMLRNKRTMQNIYNADYNFARPPRRPFLTAVPSDGKVTLVWDESSELSRDPIYGFDFEMYKIYRSTDPEFNDIKTITDAFGNPLLWEPLAQFDLTNGLSGAHPIPIGEFGISYDMGTDSGLEYSFIDENVDNGRAYYYSVVSVDQGYAPNFFSDGISEFADLASITPTESSKIIEVDAFERPVNVDRNAAVVIPQEPAGGYVEPNIVEEAPQYISGNTTADVDVRFLIPDSANARNYEYEFSFTDDNTYSSLDSTLFQYGNTTGFVFRNRTTGDTLIVSDPDTRGSAIFDTPLLNARTYDGMKFEISNPLKPQPASANWVFNTARGGRPAMSVSVIGEDQGGLNNVPRDYEIRVSDEFQDTSQALQAVNRIPIRMSLWDITDPNMPARVPVSLIENQANGLPQDDSLGTLSPGDRVEVKFNRVLSRFGIVYAGTSWGFQFNLSEQGQQEIGDISGDLNALYDSLAFYEVRNLESRPFGADVPRQELDSLLNLIDPWFSTVIDSLTSIDSLRLAFTGYDSPDQYRTRLDDLYESEMPQNGDRFVFQTTKPFSRADTVRFTVNGNFIEENISASVLDSIYVAPDPYVVVSVNERRNTQLPGRGERRIEFRRLPQTCTIRIFTISGRLVQTLYHDGAGSDSFEPWDLKSNDGLDVAYGVYIYHVDAPGIGEKVGRFALIK